MRFLATIIPTVAGGLLMAWMGSAVFLVLSVIVGIQAHWAEAAAGSTAARPGLAKEPE